MAGSHSFAPPGKYEIVEPLKRGGTAAVYLAVMRGENRFSREVVIKRPLPHLVADRRLRAMFIDEAHIASRLAHPNIVQVIDLVAREDEIYLVLEYLRGRDLREILRRCTDLGRRLPVDVSVWVCAEACAGLDFAHDATDTDGQALNLVHRDVSPKNIRITDRGAVKVIDFGIARVQHRITETAPGSVKGTLGYMSPEQAMGENIDRRSDIFAVGICLFQMLTARNPFDADNLQDRIHRLVSARIPNPSEFNPDVDATLDAIVARCLERDVDRRYQTAGELQADLEAFHSKLSMPSARQRLVLFLEEIFPDIHQIPAKLQEALTTLSGLERHSDEILEPSVGDADTAISQSTAPADPRAASDPRPVVTGPYSAWADPPPTPAVEPEGRVSIQPPPPTATPARRPLWPLIAVLSVVVLGLLAFASWRRSSGPHTEVVKIASTDPVPTMDAGAVDKPDEKVSKTKRRPRRAAKRYSARRYFRAAVERAKAGEVDDALLLYTLAYAESGPKKNPAIYRNLALLYEQEGQVAKVRACFSLYLDESADAPDAARIRALLQSYPAAPSTRCVSRREVQTARKRAERIGAKIATWLE